MSYDAYKQQLQFNSKMVYRRAYSNGGDATAVGYTTSIQAGKRERQQSPEDQKSSDETPGKLKRPLSHENEEHLNKKLKGTDDV